ncbi:hypothetical protein [Embleya hyalina]|uniref:Uncharacterized protein n=1 Tax=Embleya hyalina TaxID=516124 RepID=A0A401Z6Q8_9ACTN|nr:hypothetical protein [Embleya hyalina]GCE02550.1 hypothetical protein EHYA_10327 [Embleya hyalina]
MSTAFEPPPVAPRTGRVVTGVRLVLGAVGLAGIGWGVVGVLDDPFLRDRVGLAKWLVGGLLLHDAVFAVVVFVVGAMVMRARPGPPAWVRRTVLGGLAVGVAGTLIALPALLRPLPTQNPSVLPLDYADGLAIVWGVVAAGTALVVGWRYARGRGRG